MLEDGRSETCSEATAPVQGRHNSDVGSDKEQDGCKKTSAEITRVKGMALYPNMQCLFVHVKFFLLPSSLWPTHYHSNP